jgi:hypothetical protein
VTSLALNGLVAGLVVPLVAASLAALAAASLVLVLVGVGFWGWHLAATRGREGRAASAAQRGGRDQPRSAVAAIEG